VIEIGTQEKGPEQLPRPLVFRNENMSRAHDCTLLCGRGFGSFRKGFQFRREGTGALTLLQLLIAPHMLLARTTVRLRGVHLIHEPLDLTGGINDALLTAVKGVADGAQLRAEIVPG